MTINFTNNNLLGSANFLSSYKTSKARVCVTVGMMTTGYDCPDLRRFDLSGRRIRQHYLEAIQYRESIRYQILGLIGCNCELEFMIGLTPHRSLLAEPYHSVWLSSPADLNGLIGLIRSALANTILREFLSTGSKSSDSLTRPSIKNSSPLEYLCDFSPAWFLPLFSVQPAQS
jgi:hypothetical protein